MSRDKIRKDNSNNPKWVEELIEEYDVWIEYKESNKLHINGTFSANELRIIADAMDNNGSKKAHQKPQMIIYEEGRKYASIDEMKRRPIKRIKENKELG